MISSFRTAFNLGPTRARHSLAHLEKHNDFQLSREYQPVALVASTTRLEFYQLE